MSKKNQGTAPAATPAATDGAQAPATTPAATPAATPATGSTPHLAAELDALVKSGRATGPLSDDGRVANSKAMKRLLAEHPEDADAFLRDGAGNLAVFDLTDEKGKKALVRRSAGPSRAWFVVRTSDVHQQRFVRSEKPKGSSRGSKALAPASGVSLADLK